MKRMYVIVKWLPMYQSMNKVEMNMLDNWYKNEKKYAINSNEWARKPISNWKKHVIVCKAP
tara:strand:+ start:243 stop:425 length:183 start_codon:yes stop_codon:yes gene_type:complete